MKRFIFALTLLLPFSVQANEHLLIPMLGLTNWSDESGHTARANSITFDDDTSFTLGFKYLYRLDNGFAFGGNISLYEKDVAAGQANDAGVSHFHALAQYYFTPKASVSPFIGAGLGFSGITFDGGVLDDEDSSGTSYELNGGVQFSVSETIGLLIEYRYMDFDIDDEIDGFRTDINSDSHSLMFGVAIIL